jgi:hypothetical protein
MTAKLHPLLKAYLKAGNSLYRRRIILRLDEVELPAPASMAAILQAKLAPTVRLFMD